MKCFIAKVEIEMPVWAKDEAEAKRIAKDNIKEDVYNLVENDFDVAPMTYYPGDWEDDLIIYADRGIYITIKEAAEKTPEYQSRLKQFQGFAEIIKKRPSAPNDLPPPPTNQLYNEATGQSRPKI